MLPLSSPPMNMERYKPAGHTPLSTGVSPRPHLFDSSPTLLSQLSPRPSSTATSDTGVNQAEKSFQTIQTSFASPPSIVEVSSATFKTRHCSHISA